MNSDFFIFFKANGYSDLLEESFLLAIFLDKAIIFCNSVVPSTRECDDKICSTSVEPDLGRPTTNIGSEFLSPTPSYCLIKSLVKKFINSLHSFVKFLESHGTCLLFMVLPFVYAAIADSKFLASSSALPNANSK